MTDRATIIIKNLRLRTFIGFNDEERLKKQDVVINAKITHFIKNEALTQDEVDFAFNYKTITKAIIEKVENNQFLLLEKMTNDILEICSNDEAVITATVTAEKPHALRFADSVAIELTFNAEIN